MNAPVANLAPPAAAKAAGPAPRNPGPSWGYQFLRLSGRVVPERLYRPARAFGTWIALAGMPAQRRHSRDYLRIMLGREPTLREVFRHFFAFEEMLMLKLRVADGLPHRCALAPDSAGYATFLQSGENMLLGTFHVGRSELAGFLLGADHRRQLAMIRRKVGNSHDIERLAERFGRWVRFVWVNEPDDLLFALKQALAEGGSVALQCDRPEFSSRLETFEFLGARRLFPFAIYHLALLFRRPVLLSVAVPAPDGGSVVHASPRWAADPALDRAQNLAAARAHFQAFLARLEALLRADPYQWFNYTALNPAAPAEAA